MAEGRKHDSVRQQQPNVDMCLSIRGWQLLQLSTWYLQQHPYSLFLLPHDDTVRSQSTLSNGCNSCHD